MLIFPAHVMRVIRFVNSNGFDEDFIPLPGKASLWSFIGAELTRDFVVEGDEERLEARRRNLYTLLAIPRSVEQFVAYGFFQCTDAFLYLFTILPLRFLIALKSIIIRPIYTLVR
jgi:hypothetical protein